MKIINLGATDSLLQPYLAQIRDKSVQKDSMRFRKNLERIGEIFAYEISKTLGYQTVDVETPLGIATTRQLSEPLVLATILRAGLPVHQGMLNCFDNAQNAFVAAYRKYGKGNECDLLIEYQSCPPLEGKTLIITDAMIASGASWNSPIRAWSPVESRSIPTSYARSPRGTASNTSRRNSPTNA